MQLKEKFCAAFVKFQLTNFIQQIHEKRKKEMFTAWKIDQQIYFCHTGEWHWICAIVQCVWHAYFKLR